jgi:hypothetical protein
MIASTVIPAQAPPRTGTGRWLLLIHQLPPKPDYVRVKVRRRLQGLGAVALKNSVYVLPHTAEALEDFHWLRREILQQEGEATVCASDFVEGLGDLDVEELFRAERNAEYADLVAAARAEAADPRPRDAARLRRLLTRAAARDHFDAPGRAAAESAVRALEVRLGADPQAPGGEAAPARPRGARWVTRAGVHVDRMASAWLIRRFIDPEARFAFVPARGYRPRAGELRFDMFEGEYTHEGDRCTFETLCARFRLREPALAAIGQIVHDIDCKDEKFGRPETEGVAAVVRGISAGVPDDPGRLEAARPVFDGLYAQLKRRA